MIVFNNLAQETLDLSQSMINWLHITLVCLFPHLNTSHADLTFYIQTSHLYMVTHVVRKKLLFTN